MADLISAEFKGSYRAPHPDGIRDANITKNFHVRVKMKRSALKAPGLKGLFATYYKEFVREAYPDMIDLYEFDLVQATELDGTIIHDPKALSYDGLLNYISTHKYPINPMLYSRHELRNEVALYEVDKSGQQHLQNRLQQLRGNALEMSAELSKLADILEVVEPFETVKPTRPLVEVAAKKSKAEKEKADILERFD